MSPDEPVAYSPLAGSVILSGMTKKSWSQEDLLQVEFSWEKSVFRWPQDKDLHPKGFISRTPCNSYLVGIWSWEAALSSVGCVTVALEI